MARPYSMDLRKRVVGAVESGQSRHAVAKQFGLAPSCVVKWMQRVATSGSVAPDRMGGRRPYALASHRLFVLSRIEEKPDLTIDALKAELAERGIVVGRFAIWHFLKHEKQSFKKKPARQRAGPSRRGQAPRALEKAPGKTRS